MQDLLSILFYIRKSKTQNLDLGTIYLRITYNGSRSELSTFLKVNIRQWNAKANKFIGASRKAKEINRNLDLIKKNVYRAYQDMVERQEDITAKKLRDRYLGKDDSRKHILEVFEDHNLKMETLVGKEYSFRTLQRYKTTKKHLQNFIQHQFNSEDLQVKDIDTKCINSFTYYLKTKVNLSHNSTIKYLSYLKKVIRICYANGWIENDPFFNYKLKTQQIEKEFLSKSELNRIINKEIDNLRLEKIRDLFIFSCYTGLAYIDVTQLKHRDIILGIDGEKWIKIKRTKTGSVSNIPLLPRALQLINKYYQPDKSDLPIFPSSSNQKTNSYLKEIADICNIDKHLTFHIARHTFATTVTLSNGVPIESVSKMLGHKSLKTTQHYAKIIDEKLSQDMSKLKSIYEKEDANQDRNFKIPKNL